MRYSGLARRLEVSTPLVVVSAVSAERAPSAIHGASGADDLPAGRRRYDDPRSAVVLGDCRLTGRSG